MCSKLLNNCRRRQQLTPLRRQREVQNFFGPANSVRGGSDLSYSSYRSHVVTKIVTDHYVFQSNNLHGLFQPFHPTRPILIHRLG